MILNHDAVFEYAESHDTRLAAIVDVSRHIARSLGMGYAHGLPPASEQTGALTTALGISLEEFHEHIEANAAELRDQYSSAARLFL